MKQITLTKGCFFLMAAVALAAQGAEAPHYVAVELSLDGAVRDTGANQRNELGRRIAATGEAHAIVRRGNSEIDLNPSGAEFSQAIAGDIDVQVGSAGVGAHSHAMVWRGTAQSAVDLHSALPAWYTDSVATGIDDAGNVTGVAIDAEGTAHDILWRAAKAPVSTFASGSAGGNSGGSGSGSGGGGGAVATDKVSITRALWFGNPMAPPTGELLVQATSSRQDAVLTLSDTISGQVIATLPNIGGGRYGGSVIFRYDPVASVTVTSNLGGTNSRSVILGVQ
jgi:hypothetical protein